MELDILYRDEHLVAVDKPSGLLVHPSYEATDRTTCMSILRDQLGRLVYPLHRLDRGTSGVLLMALDTDTARLMNQAFAGRRVQKTYLAITRGWLKGEGTFDRPMRRENNERDEAVTHFRTLAHGVLPYPVGRYPEGRYSLVEARPVTGRRHQIRRHLSNANYPIVGDAVHGDGKHNQLFRNLFGCYHLLLHALHIEFEPPFASGSLTITAPVPDDFGRICLRFGWGELQSVGVGEPKAE